MFCSFIFKELIRQAEDKLGLLEGILYNRQHPVRDTVSEQSPNRILVKVQKCTSEVEERLSELVEHSKMLKKLKEDVAAFHCDTSAFLSDCSSLLEEVKSIDKDKSDADDFENVEVRIFYIDKTFWIKESALYRVKLKC